MKDLATALISINLLLKYIFSVGYESESIYEQGSS